MLEILLILALPLAGWAGWGLASVSSRRGERKRSRQLSNRYFQGLNYLLNEQPDKALQVFLDMAEVNRDTVETHLALGSLFRRRGEVDRAIRLHQNIISKRNLDEKQRTLALLELGEDYMRAGLFDRAERLFSELVERKVRAPSALRNLLDIYQQEKEWEKALEIATQLDRMEPQHLGYAMSHFSCELAEAELARGANEAARKQLRRARRHDPQSVRAEVINARLEMLAQNYAAAMSCYERIAAMDPDYLRDILDPYFEAAEVGGEMGRAREQLARWVREYDGISVVLRQADFVERDEGRDAAADYLAGMLERRGSVAGLNRLMALREREGEEPSSEERILRSVIERLLRRQSTYRCGHCGFSGHQHHWQCPSCKQWGTTKVIRGVLGE